MVAFSRHLNHTLRLTAFILFVAVITLPGLTHADNLDVGAVVPYPAPTQAATIDGNLNGTSVNAALQTLTGTCQLQNPTDVVTVWRDNTSIGSAPCNGTYSLQIMLRPGDNTLVIRTANPTGQYGPDSAPIIVTLILPPTPDPPSTPAAPSAPTTDTSAPTQSPTVPTDQTPIEIMQTTNAGAASDFTATTKEPFSVLTTNNDVTVNVTVGGGQSPYTIKLDWGDGSTESHSVDQAGTYAFTHAYVSIGNYLVRGDVHDVLGASTQFSYAVVSGIAQPIAAATTTVDTPQNPLVHFIREHWKPIVITSGSFIVAGTGYYIGVHRAVEQAVAARTRALRRPAKRPIKLSKR